MLTPHKNRLGETVLMRGHNICLNEKIKKIILKLFLLPLLIWSTFGWAKSVFGNCHDTLDDLNTGASFSCS